MVARWNLNTSKGKGYADRGRLLRFSKNQDSGKFEMARFSRVDVRREKPRLIQLAVT